MERRLEALTYPRIQEHIQNGRNTAVLPIGAVEQHGPHCPLGTDAFIARAVSRKLAETIDALCLPPQWFGVSPHHMGFSGTINLRPAALTMFVEDILESLIAHGFENLLVLNGHGGNTPAIETAKMNIKNRRRDIFLATSSVWLALQDVYETLPETMRQESFRMMVAHGGLFETAAVMAEEPEAVLLDRVTPVPVDAYVQATRPHMQVAITVEDIAGEVGANGDAGPATVEMGEMFIERTVAEIAKAYREALSVFRKTE